MDASETRLGHVYYELSMLRYTYGKLLEAEKFIALDPTARQKAIPYMNALIEAFCIHARNLYEFFQSTGESDTLKARKFADGFYRPLPSNTERKRIIKKIHKQIGHLSKKRTSVPAEQIGTAGVLDIPDEAVLLHAVHQVLRGPRRAVRRGSRCSARSRSGCAHAPAAMLPSFIVSL